MDGESLLGWWTRPSCPVPTVVEVLAEKGKKVQVTHGGRRRWIPRERLLERFERLPDGR